jgi:hypothetical protein
MKFHLKLWSFAIILATFASCLEPEDPIEHLPSTPTASEESNDIVWEWMEYYLVLERTLPGFRPAPTCRALAYINMGAYETAIPGTDHFVSLAQVIDDFPALTHDGEAYQIDWTIALNAYYARTFEFFMFSATDQQRLDIQAKEASQLYLLSQGVPQGIVNASITWGRQVADAVINFSELDEEGATQAHVARPSDYFPPQGQGLWEPTNPDFGAAMFPYWGRVKAFAANSADLTALPPPFKYSTDPASQYYKDNLEVYSSLSGHDAEWIAEFWSDDLTGLTFSPPARIIAITNQVIKLEKTKLDETLHLYCKLGIALNDAAVGCWKSKYIYNTERPVAYIREHIDPNFKPLLGRAIHQPGLTPSFPGYPSGHSTFAGVSWRILEHFFGPQYHFTDLCHQGRAEFNGYPRSFDSWKEMAEENAFSRIPLGVHIRMDCTEGLRLGNLIAVKALDLEMRK